MTSYNNYDRNKYKNLNDLSDNSRDKSVKNANMRKFEDMVEDFGSMLSYFRTYPD